MPQAIICLPTPSPKDDQPTAGPNPYALLLASLAACKAMTVRLYAERKDIPLEAVNVSLEHPQGLRNGLRRLRER